MGRTPRIMSLAARYAFVVKRIAAKSSIPCGFPSLGAVFTLSPCGRRPFRLSAIGVYRGRGERNRAFDHICSNCTPHTSCCQTKDFFWLMLLFQVSDSFIFCIVISISSYAEFLTF
jgi:hypothetical protein